jgi:hypothetical protein
MKCRLLENGKHIKRIFYMHGQTTKSAYCKLFCLLHCKKPLHYTEYIIIAW